MKSVTLAFLLVLVSPFPALATAKSAMTVREELETWIRQYEDAWRTGEVSDLMALYDRSLICILRGKEMHFTECTKAVALMVRRNDRPGLRLWLESVRSLGPKYALAIGRVITVRSRRRTVSRFTLIFVHRIYGWKLIYSQS